MELKEYIEIVKKNFHVFLYVVGCIILLGLVYYFLRPVSYTTSITIDITRKGAQSTPDYKFDDFYRLQADERFAETLVGWLKSPSVVSEIFRKAGEDTGKMTQKNLTKVFDSKKVSSQVVIISFSTKNMDESGRIAESLLSALVENTDNLNKDQNQENWFKIIGKDNITKKNTVSLAWLILGMLLGGIFVAFWVVFLIHYLN